MDFRQQLNRISEQLSGLSASQRMLTICLVAIMLITLVWWGRYAATPEMVPVLDRSISGEEMSRVKGVLLGAGITPRVVNDRILVPAEKQFEALAALSYARALPQDSADAWNEIVKQSSPWETSEKSASESGSSGTSGPHGTTCTAASAPATRGVSAGGSSTSRVA